MIRDFSSSFGIKGRDDEASACSVESSVFGDEDDDDDDSPLRNDVPQRTTQVFNSPPKLAFHLRKG